MGATAGGLGMTAYDYGVCGTQRADRWSTCTALSLIYGHGVVSLTGRGR